MKTRLDQLLVTRGLAPTRAKAQALILAGRVFLREVRIDKAGLLVADDAEISVRGEVHPYVSRGGVKLAGALDAFAIDPSGLTCVDLGASTGGFTDCLLRRGAARVVAVDVGYGLLAQSLRDDARVTVLERTNARELEPAQIGGPSDLIVVDASFIGLGKLLAAIHRCLRDGGTLVGLIKPQFEVGREAASKTKGIVKDPALRRDAIARTTDSVRDAGFDVKGVVDCVIAGAKGNLEAFVHAVKRG